MEFSKYLLFPLSILYDLITRLRNRSYDNNLRRSVEFETNVICVGNLEVGGTGKTPMIDYLIELLNGKYQVATLSRGYKRRSKGFIFAGPEDDAQTLGDEPYQLYSKYRDNERVNIAVGELRETAIPFILAENSDVEVVLLDDAFQYRTVKPSLSILLTRHSRLFYEDYVLPSGRLREGRYAAKRADIIVVTKCPDLGDAEMDSICGRISTFSTAKVFFSTIKYMGPLQFSLREAKALDKVILVSAIAHNSSFYNYASTRHQIIKHYSYPDHHNYLLKEKTEIIEFAKKHDHPILLTEKDAVKWTDMTDSSVPIYVIPIQTAFIKNGTQFDELIESSIKEYELPY